MKLYPAIDLRGGQAVRLYQGDYDQMTVYNADPTAQAREFIAAGAKYLHVVDLDGAKDDTTANMTTIAAIAKQGGLFIEVGGGIRDEARIEQYLSLGVGRCILGTIAVKDFDFTARMAQKYGPKIAVGVDTRDGLVAVNGWKEVTPEPGVAFCRRCAEAGVQAIIATDISRDGTMQGTNMDLRPGDHGIRRHCPHGRAGGAAGHGLPRRNFGQIHLHRRHRPQTGCGTVSGIRGLGA